MGSCFSQRRKSDAATAYHASPRRSLDFGLPKRLSLSKNSARPKLFMKPNRELDPLAHSTSVKKSASSRRSQSDQECMRGHSSSSSVSLMQQEAVVNCSSVAVGPSVSEGNPPLEEINGHALGPEKVTRIPAHGTSKISRTSSNQSLQEEPVKCLGKHNDSPDGSHTAVDSSCMKPGFERRSRSESADGLGKLEVPAALSGETQEILQGIRRSKPRAKLKQFRSFESSANSHTNRPFGHKNYQAIATEHDASTSSENSAALSDCRNNEGIVKSLSVFSAGCERLDGLYCFINARSSNESLVDLEGIKCPTDVHEPGQLRILEEQDSIDGGFFKSFRSKNKSAVDGRIEAPGEHCRIDKTGREREVPPVESQRGRKHEENRLSSEFFELKNGYLSLSTALVENDTSEQEIKSLPSLKTFRNEEQDGVDSETFEFKRVISELSTESIATEEWSRLPEISLVSTGDAVLYSGSNSDEFHLIPSRSYLRENTRPKQKSFQPYPPSPRDDNMSSPAPMIATPHHDSAVREQANFSIDDIILLLENEEMDEEQLLNLLINAKASRPASDVASESSFEFKVKSAGSTPHSTPSTPMLSASSTPRRISQLSPIALTPEEIAEIWGVFEQRHILAT